MVMFSDLQVHIIYTTAPPSSCKTSKGILLSPGFTSTLSSSFEQGALPQHCLGALPPLSWPLPVPVPLPASPGLQHTNSVPVLWAPPPGLQIVTSPCPALAQFLTHSRKRKDTRGVAPACLTPRASVRHMASGQPFLRKSVQAWCCPPPNAQWSFLFLRLAKNTPDRNPASLQQTRKIKLLSSEQGSGERGHIGVLPGASRTIWNCPAG